MTRLFLTGVAMLALAACGGTSETAEQAQAQDPDAATAATNSQLSEPEAGTVETGNQISMDTPVKSPPLEAATGADPVRGKGGLEEKCLAKVGDVTRAPVRGTNRIEESEAAVEIYVNVDGAQAPWKCLGNKDGSIGEVMYTGDEGAL